MLGLAGGHDLILDTRGHINRNGKRHALVAAAARVDLRVDANHLAARVEKRAARVARVDGHVGLDEGHGAVVGQRAALGADDAGGHGVFKAKGRADGQHPLAGLEVAAVTQGDHWQVFGLNLEHGHVGLGVGAQHLGPKFAPVGQLDGDFLGVLDHMGVGQNDAVGANDEARALGAHGHVLLRCAMTASALLTLLALLEALEQLAQRAVEQRIAFVVAVTVAIVAAVLRQRRVVGDLGDAGHADVDHGRAFAFGDF